MRGTDAFAAANGGMEGKKCHVRKLECEDNSGSNTGALLALLSITSVLCCLCLATGTWKVFTPLKQTQLFGMHLFLLPSALCIRCTRISREEDLNYEMWGTTQACAVAANSSCVYRRLSP